MNILIVDDEVSLTEAIAEILRKNNYSVQTTADGEEGLEYARTNDYDLIILDIMLPKIDGISVLRRLRAEKNSVPILLLSAKGQPVDRVNGLDNGADDYLTKPFVMAELLARIRALTRRKSEFLGNNLSFNGVELDSATLEISYNGKKIRIGNKEYQILETLIKNSGITGKEKLIQKVWGYDVDAEYNLIEVYISFLRKKLLAIHAPVVIRSIRNVGYQLEKVND